MNRREAQGQSERLARAIQGELARVEALLRLGRALTPAEDAERLARLAAARDLSRRRAELVRRLAAGTSSEAAVERRVDVALDGALGPDSGVAAVLGEER